jgi:hypothetical protein
VLVAFVAFGVAWLLELLQRRPDELAIVAEAEDGLLYSDVPVEIDDDANPTAVILPADESPTLDLTAETAGAPTDGAAASAPPKGKAPRR